MSYAFDYFISYAHKDNENPNVPGFVEKFKEKLLNSEEHQRLFGKKLDIFFDKSTIQNMVQWDSTIREGLTRSRFLIVLLSPEYFQSEFCAKEFDWWMQHEMHRCTLGEGTAPILIYDVANLQDANTETIPDIPEKLQRSYPNWLKQIRKIQSDLKFDMHNFLISKIDDVLNALRDGVKDKVRHQDIVDKLPYDTYPGYNEKFVGRREKLLSLRRYMTQKSGRVVSALTGLGGFGKTELALTYGHAFGWDYQLGRFFKPCDNCKSVFDAFLSCGILEKYGWEPKGTDEERTLFIFNHLKAERDKIIRQNTEAENLKTEGAHLLLILDNVNNPYLISQLLKMNLPDFIHVIITTRENTSAFADIYTGSVYHLTEDESVELLNNLRSFDNQAEAEAARKIAQLLAGFTLIVELTGAFLAKNKKNRFVTYQRQFEQLVTKHADIFQKMADKTGNLMRHAAETVTAVLESTLSSLSGNARKALDFASLMVPDAVAAGWLPELCDLNEDEGEDILNELTGYNLLTQLENEPNIARIHRLVADAVKQEIPEQTRKEIIAKIRGKCEALLAKDKTFWYISENSWNITPVSEFGLSLAEHWTIETSEKKIDWNLTWLLNVSGAILVSLGKTNEARTVLQRCLEICEKRVKTFPENVAVQQDLSIMYANQGDLENIAGNTVAAREWFEKTLKIVSKLADKLPDDDNIQRNLSAAYDRLGDLESSVGNVTAAREWYEKVLNITQQLVYKKPKNVLARKSVSIPYTKLGDLEKAVGNVTAALEWYKKALDNNYRLSEEMPEDVDLQWNLSISYVKLGDMENAAGNAAATRDWYEKALVIRNRLSEMIPDNVDFQRDLSSIYMKLGDLEQSVGNIPDSRTWYIKALKIRQRIAEMIPEDVDVQLALSSSYAQLGDFEKVAGNINSAREYYEKAMEIHKQVVILIPENVGAQLDLSASYSSLGDLENVIENVDNARKWYNKALEIYMRLFKNAPENVNVQQGLSLSYTRLGDIEISSGNIDSAREWDKKALVVFKRLVEQMPENVDVTLDLCDCYANLSNLEIKVNEYETAKEWCNNALNILEPMLNNLTNNVRALQVLGKTYRYLGNSEISNKNYLNARKWYEKALTLFKQLADLMPEDIAAQLYLKEIYEQLGILEEEAKNFDAAREWYEKNLEIAQLIVPKTPEIANMKPDLCAAYNHLGDLDLWTLCLSDAQERYENAWEIAQQLVNTAPDNADFQQCLNNSYQNIRSLNVFCERYGDHEKSEGNIEAAKTWYEYALEFIQDLAEKFPENTQVQEDLVRVQEKLAQIQK